MTSPLKVVACGGGNGAHGMAGIAAAQPNTESYVLTLFADEAERWTEITKTNEFTTSIKLTETSDVTYLKQKPKIVTKEAKDVIPGADLIVFAVPAFAHQGYLEAIAPYIEPGTIIVGAPGQPGFTFQIHSVLGDKANEIVVMNFESLPWVARLKEFGKEVEIPMVKKVLYGSVQVGSVKPKRDPTSAFQQSLGEFPVLKVSGHVIGIDLLSVNSYIHPPILYSAWKDWDGVPVDSMPLFYHGVDEKGAEMSAICSQEAVDVALAIMAARPGVDVSQVVPLHKWYLDRHSDYISDKSSLHSCYRTNSAYTGMAHPSKRTSDGKFVPDFTHRYLFEDVTYGLLVLKGIGEVAGVEMPMSTKILEWAQQKMGKEYLVNGKMAGKDVCQSRAPQRYGYTGLDAMLG